MDLRIVKMPVSDFHIHNLNPLKIDINQNSNEVKDRIMEDDNLESMKENREMKMEFMKVSKRPQKYLSPAEKIEVIERVHRGESKASVARDIGVPESTLRGWCKSEIKIRGMVRNYSTSDNEAHSPASSSEMNISYSQNFCTSHPSENEGPVLKKIKTYQHEPVNLSIGVRTEPFKGTRSEDLKLEDNQNQTLELLSMAAKMNPEHRVYFLQQLKMCLAVRNSTLSRIKNLPYSSGLSPPVGFVGNRLQYTKCAINADFNNQRHTSSPIDPTKMNSFLRSVSRISSPLGVDAAVRSPIKTFPNIKVSGVRSKINQEKTCKDIDERTKESICQLKRNQENEKQSDKFDLNLKQNESFWSWYKQSSCSVSSPTPIVENLMARKSPSKSKAELDSFLCNNNKWNMQQNLNDDDSDGIPNSVEEAVEHGEKFFKWLHRCSNSFMTPGQIMECKFLLRHLKDYKNKLNADTLRIKQSRK